MVGGVTERTLYSMRSEATLFFRGQGQIQTIILFLCPNFFFFFLPDVQTFYYLLFPFVMSDFGANSMSNKKDLGRLYWNSINWWNFILYYLNFFFSSLCIKNGAGALPVCYHPIICKCSCLRWENMKSIGAVAFSSSSSSLSSPFSLPPHVPFSDIPLESIFSDALIYCGRGFRCNIDCDRFQNMRCGLWEKRSFLIFRRVLRCQF